MKYKSTQSDKGEFFSPPLHATNGKRVYPKGTSVGRAYRAVNEGCLEQTKQQNKKGLTLFTFKAGFPIETQEYFYAHPFGFIAFPTLNGAPPYIMFRPLAG